jgi:hypothetical protein
MKFALKTIYLTQAENLTRCLGERQAKSQEHSAVSIQHSAKPLVRLTDLKA